MESEHQSVDDLLPKNANILEATTMENPLEPAAKCSASQADESSDNGRTFATQVLQGNMITDPFVYRQDVVSCGKYEGLLGIVMEVAGDSDSDGSITDDTDNEDEGDENVGNVGGVSDGGDNNGTEGDDENDSLQDGQARVVWTDGSETTDNISDITVVDRGFLHGDIVASASNPTEQLGLVVDVNITVDLRAANEEVINHVSSKDLKRIREFTVGDYVIRGPWLGRVDDVLDNVTILFDDGSVCKVVKADPLRLQPVSKPVMDDANCPYYPGQRIRAVSSSVFKSSRWLSGLWKANRVEGTVIKVETASVVVYWIASAYLGIGTNSSIVPSEEQNPKDLTLLDCFSYANWQLCDWCLLPSSSNVTETLKSSKTMEPIEDSQVMHSEDCSTGEEQTDVNINSCAESSGQDSHAANMVGNGDQSLEQSDTMEIVIDETVADLQLINGAINLQLLSGDTSNDHGGNTTSEESKCGDAMDLDRTIKLGENNVPESNSIFPDGGSSSSLSSVSKEATHESWHSYRRKLRKVLFKRDRKARRRDETFERALFIIKTETKVDVAWQNGIKEYGLDSKSLIPIQTPSDHEFFPEQYVVEKASYEGDDASETKRVGIVRSLNAKEKTVRVRWFKPVSRPEDARECDCEEVVSAYELDEHPDYDYCYGDVVVRLSPASVGANTMNFESVAGNKEQSDMMESEGSTIEKQSKDDCGEQLSKDKAWEDFTCLSWVGNITGLQDGDIEVTWADGMVSKVGPQAIYVVGRDDDGDSLGAGSEVSDDGASWETVDENDMNTLVNIEQEAELRNSIDEDPDAESKVPSTAEDSNLGRSGPLSMPLAALGFVTRFATGLFSRGWKQSDSDDLLSNGTESQQMLEPSDEEASIEELGHEKLDALGGNCSQKRLETAGQFSHKAETEDVEMTETDLDSSIPVSSNVDSSGDENHYTFKHFDITENPVDHYFLDSNAQNIGGKKWVKKVQQEWSILEKNLPDAVFVRVFEDRMDLLRAVIIGASGTPYQDGLFFFDFHLPLEYPQVPPSAYYHSGGLRVNPNLYVDGKVCLSLLNTWTGKGNEVWDPSSSSILQVLVSLQGLVLNAKPYFNEAGYDRQVGTIEGEKNSLPYNENTYLLNLKSMMYLLRRPPMHFEGFVMDHFRRRGHYILKACEAYMGDCTIGSLTWDACMTEKSKEHPCSVGFKLMLAKILPRLIWALTEVGVDCHKFEYLQKSENLPRI